jgi:hypothetical protein
VTEPPYPTGILSNRNEAFLREVSMVRFTVALVLGCVLALGVDAGDATKKDQQAIQGKWRMTEAIVRGEKRKPEPGVLVITANKRWNTSRWNTWSARAKWREALR